MGDFRPEAEEVKAQKFMSFVRERKSEIQSYNTDRVKMNGPKAAPKEKNPQSHSKQLRQDTVEVFYCVQCKKISMTFNDRCQREGHQQIMKIAKLKKFQCQKCKNTVRLLKLPPEYACMQCGGLEFE